MNFKKIIELLLYNFETAAYEFRMGYVIFIGYDK